MEQKTITAEEIHKAFIERFNKTAPPWLEILFIVLGNFEAARQHKLARPKLNLAQQFELIEACNNLTELLNYPFILKDLLDDPVLISTVIEGLKPFLAQIEIDEDSTK